MQAQTKDARCARIRRLSEALGLERQDVDFENLLIRVKSKGGKHGTVPM